MKLQERKGKKIMSDREDELTIVSNRLPVVLNRYGGDWQVEPGAGGLVQAMNPILTENGGCWVGWPGVTREEGSGWRPGLEQVSADSGYEMEPVVLTREQFEGFYEGFANSVVWPLFHGFADRCDFDPGYYRAYGEVNDRFAEVIARRLGADGFVWIHDYHLFEASRRLRQKGFKGRTAFFLHIPFPSIENFSKLPWRERLLSDLLHYDLVGFQTRRDLHHFETCVEKLGLATVDERGGGCVQFDLGARVVEAGAFPIGIDYADFAQRAASEEVTRRVEELKQNLGPCDIVLGVDRLDYSKGLLQRLRAYEEALDRHPKLREEVVLFQLVVPSRENVAEYQVLKEEFDREVGRINGRFATASWQPIHYRYNRVQPRELSAMYRMAKVGFVTPLRDGMNLVSKEYCASQVDEDGVLVLSEFAGAAEQLERGAILVNPYDVSQTARALYRAITMPGDERRQRMKAMRQEIEKHNVYWWAETFLDRSRTHEETAQKVVSSQGKKVAMPERRAGQM